MYPDYLVFILNKDKLVTYNNKYVNIIMNQLGNVIVSDNNSSRSGRSVKNVFGNLDHF